MFDFLEKFIVVEEFEYGGELTVKYFPLQVEKNKFGLNIILQTPGHNFIMKSNTINLNVYSFTKNINIYDVHYIKYIYNKIHNNKAINTDISELIEFIDFKIAIILLNITQIDLNIYNNLLNKNSNINEKVSNILREGFRPNYTDTYYKKLDTFKHKILGKDKFESNLLMCVYILFSYDNDNKKENAELLNLFKNNNNNDNKGVL